MIPPKNKKLTYPYVTDVKGISSYDDKPKQKITSTNVITKCARISAHSLRWTWNYSGRTCRKPDKMRRMRGWKGKIYYHSGCTVILNVKTMELYTRSRPYKNTEKMIYANWGKADRVAREFSKFAEIAIQPIHSEHPGDLQKAHLVVNNKDINKRLLPGRADSPERRKFIGKDVPYPSAKRVGAIEDGSHPGKVELTGQESAEGGIGLDWLLLEYPKLLKENTEANNHFSKNLELHLAVLQELRDTNKASGAAIQELRDAVKELKEAGGTGNKDKKLDTKRLDTP